MLRPLNYFEKAFIAQQNTFFTTCEMAARGKARYIIGLNEAPPFYAGVDFANVQLFARHILDSGVGDERLFAKRLLQYHTGNIDTNEFGVNESINTQLLAQEWSAPDQDFDIYMDYVFKSEG